MAVPGPLTGIKIEPPAGDPARMFGWMLQIESEVNPPFEIDNRAKRSIVLDLPSNDGRRVVLELLAGVDVFATNVRSSALQRLGLESERWSAATPAWCTD
jgi:crotonobetainyl-CoA:carnitine CoA-transferase CaiB-like acyl-CoA transferase